MKFEKWQALGNDYAIVEERELPFPLTAARIASFCAGHFGVFSDGILLLCEPDEPGFVARLRIFNPDGSEAELSGNGAREAILYLRRRGWTDADAFSIQTAAGEIRPTITGPTTCRVDMGRAKLTSKDYPRGADDGRGTLTADGRSWSFQHVSIGNPQCSIRVGSVAELEALELPAIGGAIERHALFPNRTNVSWYAELAGDRIRARIFERGVGETLSSGTGATGAAVAHVLRGGGRTVGTGASGAAGGANAGGEAASTAGAANADGEAVSTVTVVLDGGELEVEVADDLHVNLTGWAVPVFSGRLSEEFLKELHATE